jgi:hypothetical protein
MTFTTLEIFNPQGGRRQLCRCLKCLAGCTYSIVKAHKSSNFCFFTKDYIDRFGTRRYFTGLNPRKDCGILVAGIVAVSVIGYL